MNKVPSVDLDEIEKTLYQTMGLNPNDAKAHNTFGIIQAKAKLVDKAPEIFTPAEVRALLEATLPANSSAPPLRSTGRFSPLRKASIPEEAHPEIASTGTIKKRNLIVWANVKGPLRLVRLIFIMMLAAERRQSRPWQMSCVL